MDTVSATVSSMERDIRKEAGLDDRPVILALGDSATLPTGVARVVRGICGPLVDRGKFQVVQHGWFHIEPRTLEVNFRIIPVRRHPAQATLFDPEDRWGQQTFDKVIESLHPQIVLAVADYTRVEHVRKSKYRTSFAFIHYLPIDTFPPNPLWAEAAQAPDATVYYTEIARRWGMQANVPGVSIPHGIDPEVFRPAVPEERVALRQKYFGIAPDQDTVVVGTVGRNQRRKRHDLLIEAIAHLYHGGYSRCGGCNRVVLHTYTLPGGYFEKPTACGTCSSTQLLPGHTWPNLIFYLHTDPDEPGQDAMPIRKLLALWQIDRCTKLNPGIDLRIGRGLSDLMLAGFYNCLDVYAHPADGGGWELPPMEAAACGVPIVAVDAPAQNEYLQKMPGCRLVPGDPVFHRDVDGYRVYGRLDALCQQLLDFLQNREARLEAGRQNVQWAQAYDWRLIAERWERICLDVLSPALKTDRWRSLVEVS
jgi:glycosyltransferase involved in cell wall biosynthesis